MNRTQRRSLWRAAHREKALKAAETQAVPPAIASRGPVSVHIGALVVRGFDRRASAQIAASFERQLGELLRTGALPTRWQSAFAVDGLRTAQLRMTSRGPDALGESLAKAVLASRFDQPRSGRGR